MRITARLRSIARRLLGRVDASSRLQLLGGAIPQQLTAGWKAPVVAARQDAAFAPVLRDLREGRVREDFAALAGAVRETGMADPLILEVGSGSGWNADVLELLLQRKFRYVAVDYSEAMVVLGKHTRPTRLFVAGDATALPFSAAACDILILGTVLMHVPGYVEAIRESSRVARRWCIFHTIPVLQHRPTMTLRKDAYGVSVVEITFNEQEFLRLVGEAGFRVTRTFESIPHSYLDALAQEPVHARTYLCERA